MPLIIGKYNIDQVLGVFFSFFLDGSKKKSNRFCTGLFLWNLQKIIKSRNWQMDQYKLFLFDPPRLHVYLWSGWRLYGLTFVRGLCRRLRGANSKYLRLTTCVLRYWRFRQSIRQLTFRLVGFHVTQSRWKFMAKTRVELSIYAIINWLNLLLTEDMMLDRKS